MNPTIELGWYPRKIDLIDGVDLYLLGDAVKNVIALRIYLEELPDDIEMTQNGYDLTTKLHFKRPSLICRARIKRFF